MPQIRKRLQVVLSFALALLVFATPARSGVCGDFNDDGAVTASDALGVLNAAIGIVECENYRCDLDGNGSINFTDLSIMQAFFFGPPGP